MSLSSHGSRTFRARQCGDELVTLEDEADGAAAKLGELVFRQVADGDAVEVNVAGGGVVEAGEKTEQRGLSGARRTHDGDELACSDGKVEALEDVDVGGAGAEALAEGVDDDHVVWGSGCGGGKGCPLVRAGS